MGRSRSFKGFAKKFFMILLFLLLFLAIALFLSDPARYAQSVLKGISLWAASVLPATFPFLFLTAVITSLPPFFAITKRIAPAAGKIFRVSGAGAGAAILAALSGYPVGARLFFDLKAEGRIGKEERLRLSCLLSTSGPPFLVGTVGTMMFESVKAGWILLFSHLLSVWIVCFFLRFKKRALQGVSAPLPLNGGTPTSLFDSVYRAVISILCVGGFIALFSCFGDMLEGLGLYSLFHGDVYAEGIIRGLLEMTTGCKTLSEVRTPLSLAISCSLVTFGGLCVLCQQLSYFSRADVPTVPFLLLKALQAVVAFFLCYLLATIGL